jgi:hypothetical protein
MTWNQRRSQIAEGLIKRSSDSELTVELCSHLGGDAVEPNDHSLTFHVEEPTEASSFRFWRRI